MAAVSIGQAWAAIWEEGVWADTVWATGPATLSDLAEAIGSVNITGTVTTDQASGTLYAVVTTSATPPTGDQIKAGDDHADAAAEGAGSSSVTGVGLASVVVSGLTKETSGYYLHVVHETSGGFSNVLSSGSLTTTAGGAGGFFKLNTPFSVRF